MLREDLLAILACPVCHSKLTLVRDGQWLVCQSDQCARKYPIQNEILVLLAEEGDKYRHVAVEDLPDPQG
jgi:uncharacterized protein